MNKKTLIKYIHNSIWMILQSAYSFVLAVTVNAAAIRYLGPVRQGVLEYAKSIISIVNIVCVLGIDNIILNEAIRCEHKSEEMISNALLIRMMTGFLGCVSVFLYCMGGAGDERNVIALQAITLLFNALTIFKEWFLLKLNSKAYVLICMASATISAGGTFLLVQRQGALPLFALIGSVEMLSLLIGLALYLRCRNAFRFTFTFKYTRSIIIKGFPFLFADLSIVLYNEIDKIMLKEMLGAWEVGIYSIAHNVGMLWDFIPLAFIQSMRPLMLQAMKDGEKKKATLLNAVIVVATTLICAGANICLLLLGKPYISLIYRQDYLSSVNYVWGFGISVFFSMLGCIGSIWLLGKGLEKYSAYRTAAGAVCNLILNYLMIPVYGITGAVVATLFTQIFVSCLFIALFSDTREIICAILGGYIQFIKNIGKIRDMLSDPDKKEKG